MISSRCVIASRPEHVFFTEAPALVCVETNDVMEFVGTILQRKNGMLTLPYPLRPLCVSAALRQPTPTENHGRRILQRNIDIFSIPKFEMTLE